MHVLSLCRTALAPILRRTGRLVAGLLLLGGLATVHAQTPDSATSSDGPTETEMKAAATDVVDAWLQHIDADEFGAAYDAMTGLVTERVDRARWVDMLDSARQYVDAPSTRDAPFAQFRETKEPFEGGPFVSIVYEGEYELGTFSEFVLARKDGDAWSVVTYQIMPHMQVLREHEEIPEPLLHYPPMTDE